MLERRDDILEAMVATLSELIRLIKTSNMGFSYGTFSCVLHVNSQQLLFSLSLS